jgi:plasmid stability protein
MAQLLVRNVSEQIAKLLKKRAAEHGVSAEEEHRRILQEVLDPTNGKAEKPNLFDDIRQLGKIAPDFEFGENRREWSKREIEL